MSIPRNMHRLISTRSPTIKIFVVFVSVILIYNLFIYNLFDIWRLLQIYNKNETIVKYHVELQYVVVHFDLKGAPPKLEYLLSLLPMLREFGVNGLLMEYEDMFPYEGKLRNLSAKNCYDRSHLHHFIEIATHLGFEIIPLIQTFGHLEYALKLEEFRHLREDPAYPDSICPSKAESRALIMQMLDQVVGFHASISPLKHIHVGCDEVFVMNECKQCKNKGLSNEALYVDYVRYVSDVMSELSPDTTVLIWDDMLRQIKPSTWQKIDPFKKVEPMYWHYAELHKFPHLNMMNYQKKFKNQWFATAFKGADGKTATVPNIHNRLMNHFSWFAHLQTATVPGKNIAYNFKGIVLTGWSRFSHMDPICELLPVSIPSLIINLRMINIFNIGAIDTSIGIDKFYGYYLIANDRYLSCYPSSKLVPNIEYISDSCYFKDHKLYNLTNLHIFLTNDIKSVLISSEEVSAFEYYFASKYINKNKLQVIQHLSMYTSSLARLNGIEREMTLAMKEYYEEDVITEYIGSKSFNIKQKLVHLIRGIKTCLLYNGSWERRPTIHITDLSIY